MRRFWLAPGLIVALLLSQTFSLAGASEADRTPVPVDPVAFPGAYPFALGFDQATLKGDVQVSPDDRWVAYHVYRKPADFDPNGKGFRADGTPFSMIGVSLHLAAVDGTAERVACRIDGATWGPSWSPDGSMLALYSNAGGSVGVWLHDVVADSCRKVNDAPVKARMESGHEPVWAPDGRHLYVPLDPQDAIRHAKARENSRTAPVDLAQMPSVYSFRSEVRSPTDIRESENDDLGPASWFYVSMHNAELASIDVQSGSVRMLVPHDAKPRPSALRRSASGRWLSYLSIPRKLGQAAAPTYDLVVLPASGGTHRVILKNRIIPTTASDFYRQVYQWHPVDEKLIYLDNGRLWIVDFSGDGPGQARQLGSELGQLSERPLAFSRDGRYVIVGTSIEADAEGHATGDGPAPRVALVPINGEPAIPVRIDSKRWELARVLQADTRTAWQPEADSIVVEAIDRQARSSAIVSVNLRSGRERILRNGAPMRLNAMSATTDHRSLFVRYEDFATPQDVYAFTPRFSKRQLTSTNPQLAGLKSGTLHVFETVVPHFDGTQRSVSTAVILPPGKKPGDRVPAIVMIYPGLELAKERGAAFAGGSEIGVPTAVFTSRGYAVVYPHVLTGPGGESGHVINEIVDSLMPQVYRAADLGFVDIGRLALAGQSFGAFSTVSVLTRTTLFRAAVATNGVYDLGGEFYGKFLVSSQSDTSSSWVESGQPRIGAHLWKDLSRVIDNNPYYQAHKIRNPLLLVHGMDDPGVADAQKMYTALQRLERPVQLTMYEGSDHVISLWPRANAIDASMRIVAFFREHLGDPTVEAATNLRGSR